MDFRAQSDDNRKLQVNWDLVNQYVGRYKPHTNFEFSLTLKERKVSDPMRRFYFAVVVKDYGNHLGYDADEHLLLHHQLKVVYFKCEQDDKGIYRNVPSVFGNKSTLPISEKKLFLKWVVRCAARDGKYIEMPGGE